MSDQDDVELGIGGDSGEDPDLWPLILIASIPALGIIIGWLIYVGMR